MKGNATVSQVEQTNPIEEHRFHNYVGSRIPWYVRLVWVLFWCFAVFYSISYMIPAVQREMITPP